jgi:hypothetical protein
MKANIHVFEEDGTLGQGIGIAFQTSALFPSKTFECGREVWERS